MCGNYVFFLQLTCKNEIQLICWLFSELRKVGNYLAESSATWQLPPPLSQLRMHSWHRIKTTHAKTTSNIVTLLWKLSPAPSTETYSTVDQGWELDHQFSERITVFFCKKWANNEQKSDSLKKQAIRSFAHFWWVSWAICSHRSFLVSDLRDLLTSLKKWAKRLVFFLNLQKNVQKSTKNMISVKCFERITRFYWAKEQISYEFKKRAICSFPHL